MEIFPSGLAAELVTCNFLIKAYISLPKLKGILSFGPRNSANKCRSGASIGGCRFGLP